jgi:hypothetical protein
MLCEAVCPCGEPVGAIAPCSEVLGRQVYCEESGTWFEATPEHVRYWFRLAGTGVAAGSKKKEKTR